MTNIGQDRTKSRITYTATIEGINRAEKALIRLGVESKTNFAQSVQISRTTVNKFFKRQPIQQYCFETICVGLKLNDWKEIAGINNCDGNKKELFQEKKYCDQTIDKVPFSMAGSVDFKDIAKLKSIIQLIRKLAKDDLIDIIDLEQGSIKLIVNGSSEGLARLKKLFQSGEMTQVFKQELNVIVENVAFIDTQNCNIYQPNNNTVTNKKQLAFTIAGNLNQADLEILKVALINISDNEQEIRNQNKSYLAEEIKVKGAVKQNLVGVDLSGIDLSFVDLSDADLSGTKLNGADLRITNLSYSNLRNADLSDADLSGSDLTDTNLLKANLMNSRLHRVNLIRASLIGADLRNASLLKANLTDTDLSGANVQNTHFGDNLGLSNTMKRELKSRGAIFEDFLGDRSETLTHA